MYVTIGTARTFKRPDSWEITPDDRQTKEETIGSVFVVDAGIVPAGDVITLTAVFDADNWAIVRGYWTSRTLVAVTDHAGNSLGNKRVKVTRYNYVDKFEPMITATIELWGA